MAQPGVAPTPLWNQKLSSVPSYQVYTGLGTMVNTTNGPLDPGHRHHPVPELP